MNLLSAAGDLDRRWLYTALFVAVSIPVFVRMRPPIPASRDTMGVYRAIENTPPGRLVMLQPTWDAGTVGECRAQFRGIVTHLMRNGIPFVVWTSNPSSPPFYQPILEEAARRFHRSYGIEWVDFGYKVPGDQVAFAVQAMARDFPRYMQSDIYGTPAGRLPILRGVRDASSFWLAISVGYNPTPEFIQFMEAVYGTKVAFAAAAINSTMLYSYIDAQQITGILVGARGGAEYEMLMSVPGEGVDIIIAQSFGHLLIVFVVLLGNVAFIARRYSHRHGHQERTA
ncbi:MAG: hypothetical protein ACP5VE_08600 [Chthonomonadales bacterium]